MSVTGLFTTPFHRIEPSDEIIELQDQSKSTECDGVDLFVHTVSNERFLLPVLELLMSGIMLGLDVYFGSFAIEQMPAFLLPIFNLELVITSIRIFTTTQSLFIRIGHQLYNLSDNVCIIASLAWIIISFITILILSDRGAVNPFWYVWSFSMIRTFVSVVQSQREDRCTRNYDVYSYTDQEIINENQKVLRITQTEVCGICHGSYHSTESIGQLPCYHYFHVACLEDKVKCDTCHQGF